MSESKKTIQNSNSKMKKPLVRWVDYFLLVLLVWKTKEAIQIQDFRYCLIFSVKHAKLTLMRISLDSNSNSVMHQYK